MKKQSDPFIEQLQAEKRELMEENEFLHKANLEFASFIRTLLTALERAYEKTV